MIMDKTLTEDQYNILQRQRGDIDGWIHTQTLRNLPMTWLRDFQDIYQQMFGGYFIDIHCPSCMGHALSRIYHKIGEYEAIIKEKIKESIEDLPRRGRKAKDFIYEKKDN